ncbi:hypothetical protein [Alteromonas sp. 009811495]|nr:hypothetical protein [Alteromonas sp. 009811495]WDT85738.1 hypothetical protein OZ660_17670 [Alteromonas sp. 009811495]
MGIRLIQKRETTVGGSDSDSCYVVGIDAGYFGRVFKHVNSLVGRH